MNHYVYPNTLASSGEWMQRAVCATDPDAMHPDNDQAGIAYAKRICAACPVRLECLRDALRTDDNKHGIRGGLKPEERRAVAKRLTDNQYFDPDAVADAVRHVLRPAAPARTLRDLWDECTYLLPGGHLGWRGRTSVSFQGKTYTPKQIAFILDRRREPVGSVRRTLVCPVAECIHPRHISDNRERHRQRRAAEKAGAV